MAEKVNTDLVNNWIKQNSPNGVAKLSVKAMVSSYTIERIRTGTAPKSPLIRLAIASAVGSDPSELFPLVPKRKSHS